MEDVELDLLRRATAGDQAAMAKLLERHAPAVREREQTRIPRKWRSLLSADDVMAQSCTDAFLSIGHFVPHKNSSFRAWFMKIAEHNRANAIRGFEATKRGGRRRRVPLDDGADPLAVLYWELSSGGTTPSRHVAREEACGLVKNALRQLPDTYRLVVQMLDLEGRPVEDVARALQRSQCAVYMIRARARERLRKLLGPPSNFFSAG
ncbi:MAG: RNA polymerase sigma factor [Planctomycetes bacterium]|nr:RNA polymerase sigma factor [Planctomycetota bacterium]